MLRTLVACAVALFALPGSAAAQDAPPVFRADVQLITLPVKVTTAEAAAPLTRADFAVTVDGRPRTVVEVEAVRSAAVPAAGGAAPFRLSYSTNVPAAEGVARTVLLVVDSGALDSGTLREVTSEAERLVDQLAPLDLVGVTAIPIAGAPVEPTSDREAVRAAIRRITGGLPLNPTSFKFSRGEVILIDREDRIVTDDVIGRECFEYVLGSKAQCPEVLVRDARTMARQVRQSDRQRLRALTEIVRALPPGADLKHVVLITPGMFQEPGAQSLYRQLGGDLAERTATLSIVQVDVDEGAAENRRTAVSPDARLLTTSMELFAQGAGGDLMRLGTLASRFERLRREMDSYYVVAIAGERGDLDGEPHRVAITAGSRIVQHPPLFVRSDRPAAGREADRLAGIMRRFGAERVIPVGVQTTVVRGDDPMRLQVIVITRVPDAGAAGAAMAIEVRDGARIVTAQQGRLETGTQTAGVLSHVTSVLVPPGRYRLRVGVVDEQGRTGSVDHAFAADLPPAGPLLTSGLVIGQPTPQGPLRPTLDLDTGAPLAAVLELYYLEDAGQETPSVTLTIVNVADTSVTRRAPAAVQGAAVSGVRRVIGLVDVAGLPSGSYLLRADVTIGAVTTSMMQHMVLHAAAATAEVPAQ